MNRAVTTAASIAVATLVLASCGTHRTHEVEKEPTIVADIAFPTKLVVETYPHPDETRRDDVTTEHLEVKVNGRWHTCKTSCEDTVIRELRRARDENEDSGHSD